MKAVIESLPEKAFGGEVYRAPVKTIDEFYIGNEESLAPTGRHALLKSLGIPVAFFIKQESVLQKDIIVAQKSLLTQNGVEEINCLVRKNEVVYAAPRTGPVRDVNETLGIEESKGWRVRREDFRVGLVRYLMQMDDSKAKSYVPSIIVDTPFLYTSNLKIKTGLYKAHCANSVLEGSNSAFEFNVADINAETVSLVYVFLGKQLLEYSIGYDEVMNRMKEYGVSLEGAYGIIVDLQQDGIIPKTLVGWCMRHLDLLSAGRDVDERSPSGIASLLDVMDVVTYYAQKLPSINSQSRVESKVMSALLKAVELGNLPLIDMNVIKKAVQVKG